MRQSAEQLRAEFITLFEAWGERESVPRRLLEIVLECHKRGIRFPELDEYVGRQLVKAREALSRLRISGTYSPALKGAIDQALAVAETAQARAKSASPQPKTVTLAALAVETEDRELSVRCTIDVPETRGRSLMRVWKAIRRHLPFAAILLALAVLAPMLQAQAAEVRADAGAASLITRGVRSDDWRASLALDAAFSNDFDASVGVSAARTQDGGSLDLGDPSAFRSLAGFVSLRRSLNDSLGVGCLAALTWSIEGDIGAPVDANLYTGVCGLRVRVKDTGYVEVGGGWDGPVGDYALVGRVFFPLDDEGQRHTYVRFSLPFDRNALDQKTWTLEVGALQQLFRRKVS